MSSVLGTILDPAADKILMTTLTVTLAMKSMLPSESSIGLALVHSANFLKVPLAAVILGRDVLLGLSAFYIRYKTLPPPVRVCKNKQPSVLTGVSRGHSQDIGIFHYLQRRFDQHK